MGDPAYFVTEGERVEREEDPEILFCGPKNFVIKKLILYLPSQFFFKLDLGVSSVNFFAKSVDSLFGRFLDSEASPISLFFFFWLSYLKTEESKKRRTCEVY